MVLPRSRDGDCAVVRPRTMAMKGDPAILRTLNAVLTNELTAVNLSLIHI